MLELIKKVIKAVTSVLAVFMATVLVLAVAELGWIILKDIISPPVLLLEIDELLDIFALFLLVMIGIELLETIKAYLADRVLHAEVIILVGIIALARKVVVLDVKSTSGLSLIGIGVIILALAGAYFLFKRGRNDGPA